MSAHVIQCRKDVRLPVQMQRAMAAEAESTRDARAKVTYDVPVCESILEYITCRIYSYEFRKLARHFALMYSNNNIIRSKLL